MGKKVIKREMIWMGKDLVILISNEAGAHAGCCVMAQPYQKGEEWHVTLNTINRLSHKDDVLASQYAKVACVLLHTCVCVICGVHLDDLKEEEIKRIMMEGASDVEDMVKSLKEML